jgi:hypothetical protein
MYDCMTHSNPYSSYYVILSYSHRIGGPFGVSTCLTRFENWSWLVCPSSALRAIRSLFLRPAIFKKVLARSHWPKNTTELDDANDGQLISMWAKGQPWPTQFWAPSRRDSAGPGRYFRWLRWSRTWPSSATLGRWVKGHPHKVVPVVPRSWPSWFTTFYNSCS